MDKQNFYSGTLTGSVACNEVVKLKWVTEPNACKKCQELEGKLFNSVEEFEAARPHPHCKCKYEAVQVAVEGESVTAVLNEIQKAQGSNDISEEYEAVAKKLEELINEYESLLNLISDRQQELKIIFEEKYKYSDKEIEDFRQERQDLNYIKVELENKLKQMKQALNYIKTSILKSGTVENKEYTENYKYRHLRMVKDFLDGLIDFSTYVSHIINRSFYPVTLSKYITLNLHEASSMWKLSSSKFSDGMDYIQRNGQLLQNADDIDDSHVRYVVKETLKDYKMKSDIKGVYIKPDSSLASKIAFSSGLKEYLNKYKALIKPNATLPDDTLVFGLVNLDLYMAVHLAKIFDVYVDFHETITAKIFDTYDFNAGDRNLLVKEARKLQEADMIENYFTVVEISVPKVLWQIMTNI